MRTVLQQVRALVMVSGTLSPFPAMRGELGLDDILADGYVGSVLLLWLTLTHHRSIPEISTLTTPHVIDANKQLLVQRLFKVRMQQPNKPQSIPLKMDFKGQDNLDSLDAIGYALGYSSSVHFTYSHSY